MNANTAFQRNASKRSGQGMVEFALAIPIFLVLVFGVLEMGRLLFVYSAVFTASREAARYGAAVGAGPNGRPYFQDCRGMKDAAIRIGNLAGLQDGDITIVYDNPDTGKNPSLTDSDYVCDESEGKPIDSNIQLGDRVIVNVQITYEPIVGFLGLPDFDINSTARRTIVRNVQLNDAIGMALPSQTIDPSVAPGLTQTSAAITATAALTQTSAAITATAEAGTPEPACPPPGTYLVPVANNDKKVIKFSVSNPATNIDSTTIESMSIGWEDLSNQDVDLNRIQVGSTTIWQGSIHPAPTSINTWQGATSVRTIAAGTSKEISLTFSRNLSLTDSANWWVSIQFSGACEGIVTWTGYE